jgi:hypothetical protein
MIKMHVNLLFFIFFILLIFLSKDIVAQNTTSSFYAQSLKTNHYGMIVLSSWAGANLLSGAYGYSKFSGERMYFHQMNLFWNTVNISIAGFALISGLSENINELCLIKATIRKFMD